MDTRRARSHRLERQRIAKGFTLMEAGLAVGIGVVLLYAAAMAFAQARDSAGDALAKQKVADLQALVEQDYSTNHYFPSLSDLRSQWIVERDDATASPWGGPVVDEMSHAGLEGEDVPSGAPQAVVDNSRYSDVLYYYRINVPGQAVPSCCWTFQDDSKGPSGDGVGGAICTPAQGYMVAANKHYHCFYFVTSGRPAGASGPCL